MSKICLLLLTLLFFITLQSGPNCKDEIVPPVPNYLPGLVSILDTESLDDSIVNEALLTETTVLNQWDDCRNAYICYHECPGCGLQTFDVKPPPANVWWITYRFSCLNKNLDAVKNELIPHVKRNRSRYFNGNEIENMHFSGWMLDLVLTTFLDFEVLKICNDYDKETSLKEMKRLWVTQGRSSGVYDQGIFRVFNDAIPILQRKCYCSSIPGLDRPEIKTAVNQLCVAKCARYLPKVTPKPVVTPQPTPQPRVPDAPRKTNQNSRELLRKLNE